MIPQDINPLYAALESPMSFNMYLDTWTRQEIIDHIKLYAADQRGKDNNELRTRVAIAAMQGIMANDTTKRLKENIASDAVELSELLIKELNKPITDENK